MLKDINFKNIYKNITPKNLIKIFSLLKKDLVLSISFILVIISSFFSAPKVSYIDFKVLAALFNLMVVIKALEEQQVLDSAAISILNKHKSTRKVSLVLVSLCFFSSMLITNDVALLTFVPLTLIIGRKSNINMANTIILQTLGANIGSSLTPMGNPQNLFIFSYYNLSILQFFKVLWIVFILGVVWLWFLNLKIKNNKINFQLESVGIKNKKITAIWISVFFIVVLSILNVIDFKLAFLITILCTLLLNKSLLCKVDYLLLLTFVCFFLFIGNISNIEAVSSLMRRYLQNPTSTYLGSIALSQVISNVPAAILVSGFTENWRELLLGVNIGGMGTLIASLASLISYKFYAKDNPGQAKEYIIKFTIYNVVSLLLFTLIFLLI